MTAMNEEQDKNELSKAMVIGNCLMAIHVLCMRMPLANIWTIRTWLYQRSQGKRIGIPRPIKFITANGWNMGQVAKLFKQYHVNHFELWQFWTADYGPPGLECTVLVMPSQFDYADAILHQHGVLVTGGAGSKRGYNMRQPRDYNDRRPQTKERRQSAKLGKTYR